MRKYKLFLKDILQYIEETENFTAGITEDEFIADKMRARAVIYNLTIIGVAVSKIPPEVSQKYPEVDWNKLAQIGIKILTNYYKIDSNKVWQIVHKEIPHLKSQISRILEVESNSLANNSHIYT
jgi:uncharacterized protein with HEPN domain